MQTQATSTAQSTPAFTTEPAYLSHSLFADPAPIDRGFDTGFAAAPSSAIGSLMLDAPGTHPQSTFVDDPSMMHHAVVDPAMIMVQNQHTGLNNQHDTSSPAIPSWNSSYTSPTPIPDFHANPTSSVLAGNIAGFQTVHETSHSLYRDIDHTSPGPVSFQCQWQNCQSTTLFRREQDLLRHLKSIHIRPDAYVCEIEGCRQAFGRRDHLLQHRRRRHPTALQNLR